MNGRVAKRLRRQVNDIYGNVKSVESQRSYRILKKAYKSSTKTPTPKVEM